MDFKEDQQMADAVAMVRTFFRMPFAHFFIGNDEAKKIEKYLYDPEDPCVMEKAIYVPARRDTFLDIIEEYKPKQAIDIASGYSELGLRLWKDYGLQVTETIKEREVLELKQKALQKARRKLKTGFVEKHELVLLSIDDPDFRKKLKSVVDTDKRTVVITEGIQSYLPKRIYRELVSNIAKIFSECMYITIAPHHSLNYTKRQKEIIIEGSGLKRFKYYSKEEMFDILRNVGFNSVGRVNFKLRNETIGDLTKRGIETIINQKNYGIYFGEIH